MFRVSLDGATRGSRLLADLGLVNAVKAWLEPFKVVGIAILLTGISLALATIIKVIRFQSNRLVEILDDKERLEARS